MTPEQSAGLAQARIRAMANIPVGDGQDADTPLDKRPGYIADDVAYLDDVLTKWLASNPGGDVAACRERALNNWAGIDTPVPDNVPPSAPAPITVVTNFQARAALIQAGLFDTVAAAVAAKGPGSLEAQAWEYANTFDRYSTFIVNMAGALSLTAKQVDDLFLLASTLA